MANCEDICKSSELVSLLDIFKSFLELAAILVPVILIIFVMIDVVKTITSGEVDSKKLSKSIITRLIAAVVVFLIPAIINFVFNTLPISSSDFINCYNCISNNNENKENNSN